MALTFYYGSGSPFAWRVWLALEHKGIAYEFKLLSFDKGDTRSPAFLAVNPRGQVPAIVHEGYALWESTVILEYLEECFPQKPLLPADPKGRATVRRLVAEADNWLYKAQLELIRETLFRGDRPLDAAALAKAQEKCVAELQRFDSMLGGNQYFAGALSLADFTIYPIARMFRRIEERQPGNGIGDRMPAGLVQWMRRVEALPYCEKTLPPHWKG